MKERNELFGPTTRRRFLAVSAASILFSGTRASFATAPKADEQVLLFPSTARLLADGRWLARIEAWIYEIERGAGLSRLLARYLGLEWSDLSDEERALFLARTQLFRVDSESGRTIEVQFDSAAPVPLPESDAYGRVSAVADAGTAGAGWMRYRVVTEKASSRHLVGHVLALPATGLSIVTDIDDTIKQTDVRDRRQMLLNTFARELVPVPGMANWMRRCSQAEPSVSFHYVSGGPHHLYPIIAEFLEANAFPAGSVQLRSVDIAREVFGSDGTSAHKLAAIGQLLTDFPARRFVLVGDSGEHDPEIYGELVRAHPDRIVAVLIRNVTDEGPEDSRYATAMRDSSPGMWTVFRDPGRLPTRF